MLAPNTNAMLDEFQKIAMEEKTKRRLIGAARTTGAAALGTGLGYGTHWGIREALAKKLGPAGTKALGLKAAAPAMIAGGLLIPAIDLAVREAIGKERKRYEDSGSTKTAGIGAIMGGLGALGGGYAGYRAAGRDATLGQRLGGAAAGAAVGGVGGAIGGRMMGKGVANVAGAVKEPGKWAVTGVKSALKGGGGPAGVKESLRMAGQSAGQAVKAAVPALAPAAKGLAVGGAGIAAGAAAGLGTSKAVGGLQREVGQQDSMRRRREAQMQMRRRRAMAGIG